MIYGMGVWTSQRCVVLFLLLWSGWLLSAQVPQHPIDSYRYITHINLKITVSIFTCNCGEHVAHLLSPTTGHKKDIKICTYCRLRLCILREKRKYNRKNALVLKQVWSVRPWQIVLIVNLGMLELFSPWQTLQGDS